MSVSKHFILDPQLKFGNKKLKVTTNFTVLDFTSTGKFSIAHRSKLAPDYY